MINAAVVADSISPEGHRLTTFKLRYPRFVHAELMTHRALSRNASGSRAVPSAKLIEECRRDDLCAEPEHWGAEQRGMQSGGELDETRLARAKYHWRVARYSAADAAEAMAAAGLHKSLANRPLEPFTHINVLASATDPGCMNFYALRLDAAAQAEIRVLAERMWAARGESDPEKVRSGDWHLPFVEAEDLDDVRSAAKGFELEPGMPRIEAPTTWDEGERRLQIGIRVSVARCARVSYESFETGKRSSVGEDLRLFAKLIASRPIHASPAEHQATPDELVAAGLPRYVKWGRIEQHGNFVGWRQYRKMIAGEAVAELPEAYR